jgi:hypothetical protein
MIDVGNGDSISNFTGYVDTTAKGHVTPTVIHTDTPTLTHQLSQP